MIGKYLVKISLLINLLQWIDISLLSRVVKGSNNPHLEAYPFAKSKSSDPTYLKPLLYPLVCMILP